MNPLIQSLRAEAPVLLRSFFWPMLWQSSLLIALLFVIDLAFRRRLRPAVRYCVWLVVFLKLLLPPSLALPTSLAWWLRPATRAPAATRTAPLLVTYGPLVRSQSVPPSPAIALPAVSPPLPAAAWLLPMSATISLALLAWMGLRWWQIARCVNQATPVSESLLELLAETSRCVGFSRPVGLRLTDASISPAVCGFVRPVILLPRSLAERLPNSQLRAVLLHELAHLRRHDVWVNCAQALLQAAYWWHPLLWLANARVRRLREEAVDDAVMVALAHEADTYAPTLLEVAKLALARPLASLGLVGILEGRQALRRRIERLVDLRTPPKAGLTLASAICVLGLAALAVPMGQAPPKGVGSVDRAASNPGWPDPRIDGYAKVALQERFLLVDQTRLRETIPSLGESPLAVAPDQLADLEQKLQQAQAQPYIDTAPLTFEKFSGGQFHYRIGGTTNNSVNYLTRGDTLIRVFGADVAFAATQPGWTWLDLTLVPRNETEGVACELELFLENQTNSARQAQVMIPFGGAMLWATSEGAAASKCQLVVLQEMSLATNIPSPTVTAIAHLPTVKELEASQLLKDGQLLYEAGKLDEGAAKLAQSLMANSNNPSAHFYLGLIEAARATSNRARSAPASSAKALSNALVQDGKLLYEMGKFDDAQKALRDALRQDPQNQAAYYYLNLAQHASYTNVLEQGGALTNPAPHVSSRQAIYDKLRSLRLERVSFDTLPLAEVLKQLALEVKQVDPEGRGVEFLINNCTNTEAFSDSAIGQAEPAATSTATSVSSPAAPSLDQTRIKILPALVDVRLVDVLDAIVKVADRPLKYSIVDQGIIFSRKSSANDVRLYTRIFKVDPRVFLQALASRAGGSPLARTPQEIQKALFTLAEESGADLQPPKRIFFNDRDGTILVRAALQDLDTIEELVQFLNTPPPQIHISSKFIEIPAEFEREFWGSIGVTNLERQNISRILTPAQAQGILQKIKATPGVNVLAQPSVTTLDGRQCEVQVVDIMTIVTNFDPRALTPPGISSAATGGNSAFVLTASLPFGPTLNMVPHLSTDGLGIELATTGTVSEFLGYEKPKKKTPIYVDGKKHLESQPLPRFRIREITNRATVPDGYSLLLGKPVDESGLAAEEPEDGKKHLLILITPSLIDAAGNRLHPEQAVPTRK